MKGPSMPPMLAIELMRATPVAAAGPLKKVAGRAEMMPAGPHSTVAISIARKAAVGFSSISAAMTASATVAKTNGMVA